MSLIFLFVSKKYIFVSKINLHHKKGLNNFTIFKLIKILKK